jgi:16S rRNA (adenine1518-N6/adenine1519-N6)-dimethyltransferase
MIPENYGIKPDPSKDQHFLVNEKTIGKVIKISGIKPGDRILEIGAGVGTLTRQLVKGKAKVTAVEIDRRLGKALDGMKDKNLKIIYGNALDVIGRLEFNKVVSSTPYSICEPLMKKLFAKDFDLAVLIVPEKFYLRISSRPGENNYSLLSLKTSSFFSVSLKFKIPRSDFYPEPKTESVVITVKHLPKRDYERNPEKYVLKEIFLQRKKLKNSLMEALISMNKNLFGKEFTKNMARKTISKMKLGKGILEKRIEQISLKDFEMLRKKITRFS